MGETLTETPILTFSQIVEVFGEKGGYPNDGESRRSVIQKLQGLQKKADIPPRHQKPKQLTTEETLRLIGVLEETIEEDTMRGRNFRRSGITPKVLGEVKAELFSNSSPSNGPLAK